VPNPKVNVRPKSKKIQPSPNMNTAALPEPEVRARAYELYELRGRIDGYDEADWLQAEFELRSDE